MDNNESIQKIRRHYAIHQTLTESSTSGSDHRRCCPGSSSGRNNSERCNGDSTISRGVWCGRLLFVSCLTMMAVTMSWFAYSSQVTAETNLAESLFEAMTDRALLEAVRVVHEKQWTITSMATVIGALLPDAEPYPFVTLPNFQMISNDMRRIARMQTLGFLPIIRREQLQEFEDHAYAYFEERGFNMTANQPPEEKGIFHFANGTKVLERDIGGITWESSYTNLLTPALEIEAGDHPLLLYNIHGGPERGSALDVLIDCAEDGLSTDGLMSRHQCNTVSPLIISRKEDSNGPSSVILSPVFPANDPQQLVGVVGSLLVWKEVLQNAFNNQTTGIDCVLRSTEGLDFTFSVVDGVVAVRGEGDLHNPNYDGMGKSVTLTDDDLFADLSVGFSIHFYPNDALYVAYSGSPIVAALVTAGLVVVVSLLFFLYDFFVRREFSAKKELLDSKRKFMRFVSHECRTPLNAVCMSLCVVRHEIAASLGYGSAEALQQELDGDDRTASTTATNIFTNHIDDSIMTPEAAVKDIKSLPTLTSSLMMGKGKTPTKEMAIEWFNTANDVLANTQSAVEVLTDLLNFDKIETDTLVLEITKVPIWLLIESTMAEFRLSAANKKIQFDVTFHPPSISEEDSSAPIFNSRDIPIEMVSQQVVGDEVRLRQVFRNLASNAIKFTPENGSISIRAKWAASNNYGRTANNKSVNFQLNNGEYICLNSSGNLELVVEDSGVGMSPEQLSQLCSAGVQFNANELQGGKGSGLGLYITKGIIEQHNGTIAASSPGLALGTKVLVTLPLYDTTTKADEDGLSRLAIEDLEYGGREKNESRIDKATSLLDNPIKKFPEVRKEALHVLVVDDVSSNRKLLGRLLSINGHSFDQAENGLIAVDLVRKALEKQVVYDSVLLDFEMPVMNGPDAAKEIQKICPTMNIVGITGNMLKEDVAFFKSCGAHDVMGKPFNMQTLEGIWRECGILA